MRAFFFHYLCDKLPVTLHCMTPVVLSCPPDKGKSKHCVDSWDLYQYITACHSLPYFTYSSTIDYKACLLHKQVRCVSWAIKHSIQCLADGDVLYILPYQDIKGIKHTKLIYKISIITYRAWLFCWMLDVYICNI